MIPAHSNYKGKPTAPPAMARISIRFILAAPLNLPVRRLVNGSTADQSSPIIPGLFQTASKFEDFALPVNGTAVSAIGGSGETVKSIITESIKSQSMPIKASEWSFPLRK